MPRRSRGRPPSWDALYTTAAPQGGYVSAVQASEAGYSPELVHYYVREGRLERAGRGILRLAHFPPGDFEDLVPVWLWSERSGVFSHETALALHELSDALPAIRSLTVPSSWSRRRLTLPRGVRLHFADLAPEETAWKGPIPMTSPLRTVVDCAHAHTLPNLVRQAASQALRRGFFARGDLESALTAAGIPLSSVAE